MQIGLVEAVTNTVLICLMCCAIALPIGVSLALVLIRTNILWRRAAFVAISSQLVVPLYVFAGGWSAAIGTQGWLRGVFPTIFPAIGSTGNLYSVSVVHALAAIPWVCLICSMGLLWADRAQEEMAVLDGGAFNVLFKLILPKLRIWILASACWCCYPILTEMVVTNLYQVSSVAEQVYLDASRGSMSPVTYIAAFACCVFPLAVVGLIWIRTAPKWGDVVRRAQYYQPMDLELGKLRSLLSMLTWSLILLLVGVPLLSLIAKAGWKPGVNEIGLTTYGWSASRFATTAIESVSLFTSEFYWSSLLSFSSTTVAFLSAAALLIGRSVPGMRGCLALLMLTLLAVPGPLAGIVTILLLNRSEPEWVGLLYDSTLAAPILAQQFRLLPLAWILLITIDASISPSTREQMQLDRARNFGGLIQIVIPQVWPKLLVAFVLLAAISFGELSCSILVLPPGVTTVSMRLFEMLHFGMRHQDSGLSGILFLLGWLVAFSIWKTLRDR